MGLMVYLGTPNEPVNRDLLHHADWGGMLLLGAGVAMVYAGLDQGNRLDWLSSGTVMALLIGGGLLIIAFMINEMVAPRPWAHFNVLFSRNIGLSLIVILLYTLTSLSNSSLVPNFLGSVGALRPEQSGVLLFIYGALPMFVLVPVSIVLLRHLDPRVVVVLGFAAFAAANLWGTQLSHVWAREDFVGHRAADVDRAGVHAAADHHHGAGQLRSVAGDRVRGLYPDHAARRRRDRHRVDGDLAAGPRADPFELSRTACPERRCRRRQPAEAAGRRILPATAWGRRWGGPSARSRRWCSARPTRSPISTASGCASGSRSWRCSWSP